MADYKRGLLITALALFFLVLLPGISAEILIGQTESTYSLGDSLNLQITVIASSDSNGFFTSKLVCEGVDDTEIYKTHLSLQTSQRKDIPLSINFADFLVGNVQGTCYIKSEYAGESAISQKFKISKGITITLDIGGISFDPGSAVKITGKASKDNGDLVEGYAEFTAPQLEISLLAPVSKGSFELNFTIPTNALSGNYDMKVKVYEKDSSGKVTNSGEASATIRAKQLMKSIKTEFSTRSVSPETPIVYTVYIYDQAGEKMAQDVGISIYRPDKTVFIKKLVKSGESNTFSSDSNSTPGYWRIDAGLDSLETSEMFLVEEFMRAAFSLENKTLVVTNIGNVPYKKTIEVRFGEITEIKDIELGLAETAKYRLLAPDGVYDISVADGSTSAQFGSTFLTGRAIGIGPADSFSFSNIWLWIVLILIVVIAIAGVFIYRKIRKNKALGNVASKPIKVSPQPDNLPKGIAKATPAANIIDQGQKQESTVIALSLRNLPFLENNKAKEALEAIDNALWQAKTAGAKIYMEGDYRMIILSPMLTKERDNTLKAILIAQTVERILREHNKRSAQKIEFGIGINSGDLITEKHDNSFKFVSLGNTITAARRLARESTASVLISEDLRRKNINRLKAVKTTENGWKVEKIIDRSQHQDYVRTMLDRQKSF